MTYKGCNITITGYDMNYKVTIDMKFKKVYIVNYYNETYQNVKKDIKCKLRNMFRLN